MGRHFLSAVFFFGSMLAAHDRIAAAVSSETSARIVQGLYWVLPKTAELFRSTVGLVSGGELVGRFGQINTPAVFGSTLAFGIASLALASWLFARKDF